MTLDAATPWELGSDSQLAYGSLSVSWLRVEGVRAASVCAEGRPLLSVYGYFT
jgi:hypothetical protein